MANDILNPTLTQAPNNLLGITNVQRMPASQTGRLDYKYLNSWGFPATTYTKVAVQLWGRENYMMLPFLDKLLGGFEMMTIDSYEVRSTVGSEVNYPVRVLNTQTSTGNGLAEITLTVLGPEDNNVVNWFQVNQAIYAPFTKRQFWVKTVTINPAGQAVITIRPNNGIFDLEVDASGQCTTFPNNAQFFAGAFVAQQTNLDCLKLPEPTNYRNYRELKNTITRLQDRLVRDRITLENERLGFDLELPQYPGKPIKAYLTNWEKQAFLRLDSRLTHQLLWGEGGNDPQFDGICGYGIAAQTPRELRFVFQPGTLTYDMWTNLVINWTANNRGYINKDIVIFTGTLGYINFQNMLKEKYALNTGYREVARDADQDIKDYGYNYQVTRYDDDLGLHTFRLVHVPAFDHKAFYPSNYPGQTNISLDSGSYLIMDMGKIHNFDFNGTNAVIKTEAMRKIGFFCNAHNTGQPDFIKTSTKPGLINWDGGWMSETFDYTAAAQRLMEINMGAMVFDPTALMLITSYPYETYMPYMSQAGITLN